MTWTAPYLETCCRSALHRLILCGDAARPEGLKDDGCLRRLESLGLCMAVPGGFAATPAGRARHAREIAATPDPLARTRPLS
jgi:hypothetical protein